MTRDGVPVVPAPRTRWRGAGQSSRVFSPAARERRRAGWEDENHVRRAPSPEARDAAGASHVLVDAHLLCTPAIADLDGDGARSWCWRFRIFSTGSITITGARGRAPRGHRRGQVRRERGVRGRPGDAEAEVVHAPRLIHGLGDVSGVRVQRAAVVDLDRDGKMEIALGTSVGFLYVLRHDGSTARGWPKQMGEIQAQVAVADLTGTGTRSSWRRTRAGRWRRSLRRRGTVGETSP